jgi:death-on-curing protein
MISNHPFVDGNKRTAYVLMRLMLMEFGLDIEATQEEKYHFVISAAKGEIKFEEIKSWISQHLKK